MSRPPAMRVVDTGTRPPDEVPEAVEFHHLPMLEVQRADVDTGRLAEILAEPTCIVVYSRNAVAVFAELWDTLDLRDLGRHQWWAVGPKTADALAEYLDVEANVPDQKHFEGLRCALADTSLPGTVVSLSLEGKFRDLAPALTDRSVDFVDIPLYRTVPVDYPDLADRLSRLAPDWLVVTSSRGGDTLLENLSSTDRQPAAALSGIAIASIGPKTAASLEARGITVDLVPDTPDRAKLYAAIHKAG